MACQSEDGLLNNLAALETHTLGVDGEKYVTLHFRVAYMTVWGQGLVISGDGHFLGNWNPLRGLRMSCHHAGGELVWEAQTTVAYTPEFSYRYVVIDESPGIVKREMDVRTCQLHPGILPDAVVALWDEWQPGGDVEKIFATSAFSDAIFSHEPMCEEPVRELAQILPEPSHVVIQFNVRSHRIRRGQVVVVTGGSPWLGNWQPQQALELTRTGNAAWQGEIKVPVDCMPVTYKYAVRDKDGSSLTMKLERGESRMATIVTGEHAHPVDPVPVVLSRHDGYLRHAQLWKGAGVAVPVFSLRTRKSVGVGEFRDIKALVDLCEATGLRMVQILPVNDTSVYKTWWDSYPYCSLSVFALHPQYICLDDLHDSIPEDIRREIDEARQSLSEGDVNYPAMIDAKLRIARKIFDINGDTDLESEGFSSFWEKHQGWLKPYAVFCFLRDVFGTSEHWKWGSLAEAAPSDIERLAGPGTEHRRSILFTYYLQYHLHLQLRDASSYASDHRVALKGDLPIGVDKRSVDTWLHPKLFRMDKSTGAPPDMFDPNGQNWGFPTYVWEEMAKDDYAWWRARLAHMADYFHAYRIDHILGFFRIWEIPGHSTTASLGKFRPAVPLSRSELESAGVWDIDRLTTPYVTHGVLEEVFGPLAAEVAAKYFVEGPDGRLGFRDKYATERAILAIEPRAASPQWLVEEVESVKRGLLELSKNVVLLKDDASEDHFHPRFAMEDTRSWQHLDASTRAALSELCRGFFHGRQDLLWEAHALRTLPVLMGATRMLVFGEDLGFVPACVPPVLSSLGLFGLRIQRMTADDETEFGDPAKYPYMTVASPSCHDTTTTRAWWEEDAERRVRFFKTALGGKGPVPAKCTPAIARAVVQQHCEAASCWAVFPIQDILAMSPRYTGRPAAEETINDPTNPKHYWRYRMHVPIEEVLADERLLQDFRALLARAGRGDAEAAAP